MQPFIAPFGGLTPFASVWQGLTLAKPEVVPFRLTQNLIDGFGVTGIEGVFRRTCEITLQVMEPPLSCLTRKVLLL